VTRGVVDEAIGWKFVDGMYGSGLYGEKPGSLMARGSIVVEGSNTAKYMHKLIFCQRHDAHQVMA